jgi:hypothetical protein
MYWCLGSGALRHPIKPLTSQSSCVEPKGLTCSVFLSFNFCLSATDCAKPWALGRVTFREALRSRHHRGSLYAITGKDVKWFWTNQKQDCLARIWTSQWIRPCALGSYGLA